MMTSRISNAIYVDVWIASPTFRMTRSGVEKELSLEVRGESLVRTLEIGVVASASADTAHGWRRWIVTYLNYLYFWLWNVRHSHIVQTIIVV
jgi:hypothetical protein